MEKPFLTIEEQVRLLESRGMSTDENTPKQLLREGYYSIVNGYKRPFLDVARSISARDDRYARGSIFSELYELFSFDRKLREITFPYLIRAEATVKTAVAYCFSERHTRHRDYLLQENYCTREEFESMGVHGTDYAGEVSGLISILRDRSERSGTDFVKHYRKEHGGVPLWVLCNDLTFGTIEHFFNLMKPEEKNSVCKAITSSTGRLGDRKLGYFNVQEACTGLEGLVKFRNICAHDERLYCAVVGGRKQINYSRMVRYLERYLSEDEYREFADQVSKHLTRGLKSKDTLLHVLAPLGMEELVGHFENPVGCEVT